MREDVGGGAQEVPEGMRFRGDVCGVGERGGVGGVSLLGSQAFLFGFVEVARFGFGGGFGGRRVRGGRLCGGGKSVLLWECGFR